MPCTSSRMNTLHLTQLQRWSTARWHYMYVKKRNGRNWKYQRRKQKSSKIFILMQHLEKERKGSSPWLEYHVTNCQTGQDVLLCLQKVWLFKFFLCWKCKLYWNLKQLKHTQGLTDKNKSDDVIWCDNELVTDDKLIEQENKAYEMLTSINVLIICVDLAVATNCKRELKLH